VTTVAADCFSAMSEIFRGACPDRFFEMFVAEQNVMEAAIGLAR